MSERDWQLRNATPEDVAAIDELLFIHTPNPNGWNALPDSVHDDLRGLEDDTTRGVVAEVNGQIVGVATYIMGIFYPEHQPPGREEKTHAYISEVGVHRDHVARGIGPALCLAVIDRLEKEDDITEVYGSLHSDNIYSEKMQQKVGLEVVEEYDDPEKRLTGSRRTKVTQYLAS